MTKLITVAMGVAVAMTSIDAWAWGNKAERAAKRQAKAELKAEKKADKQKNGIKNWQMTRFRYMDVQSAIEQNGKLSASDIHVMCNLEEAQPLVDGLLAGYVTVVNILSGYVDVEEGNAVAGLVAKKVEGGKSVGEAVAELAADEKVAYDKYIQWLKDGESVGKIAIEDDDLEKVMTAATSFKEQVEEIKEKTRGKKGARIALAKDLVTVAKIAGSTAKGGMMLKGILDREKKAKKLLVEAK